MQDKLLSVLAIALCVIAVLVDFTSKFMSMVVDGVLLAIVAFIIYKLTKADRIN